jgi:hypothetical protein
MTQQELVARLISIFVWIPYTSIVARKKTAELILMLGGKVPGDYSESPAE